MEKLPAELHSCLSVGGDTTLMVWADCDHDCSDGGVLKAKFWHVAQQHGVKKEDFDRVVFAFAKDRLENWVEFLQTGKTDESEEGPRLRYNREVADAAKTLAGLCKEGRPIDNLPPSLHWSCENWQELVHRIKSLS